MASKKKSSARSKQRSRTKQESPSATELLVLELQEIHSAESQLARMAPRFVKAAQSEQLQQALEQRIEQGNQLIEDIESAFEEMEQSPGRKKNVAAEGLLNDLREHTQEIPPGPALDAVLIAGLQKTEHYCIAAWGTSRALAEALGIKTVAKSMARVLDEGKQLDQQLTQLAEDEILSELLADEDADEAAEEEGSDEDEDEEGKTSSGSKRRSGSERRAPN
jgi:ferritin-like metal-binding protein YciE